ncbi:hypothetical protein [Novosphingobium beihaiensis]|uniref:Uncharacterized protein n=1 Tax=Novosphingobium beihaiensis TaxID=2930389 RepID=A0ABT0BV00_9SPHN|nr:hypothetical protein [Novosphingobium beihaiensis]MCJ2188489.1 hypothetical protein [Novosphingobium beihaiensis]
MIAAFFFAVFGAFLTWVSVLNWRHRGEEKISLLEAAILKAAGEDPLPPSWIDRLLHKFHIAFASVFGPLFLFLALAMLINELGRMT